MEQKARAPLTKLCSPLLSKNMGLSPESNLTGFSLNSRSLDCHLKLVHITSNIEGIANSVVRSGMRGLVDFEVGRRRLPYKEYDSDVPLQFPWSSTELCCCLAKIPRLDSTHEKAHGWSKAQVTNVMIFRLRVMGTFHQRQRHTDNAKIAGRNLQNIPHRTLVRKKKNSSITASLSDISF